MARPAGRTPKRFVTASGEESWRVRFRTAAGAQTSETFYDLPAAEEFCKLLAALGPARALAYLDEQDAQHGADRKSPALTVDDLFEQWFAWKSTTKRDGSLLRVRSERTLKDYRSQYDRRVKPRFGSTPANLVSNREVQAWVDELVTEIEPKTVLDYHGLLRSVYLWGLHPTRALVIHDPCADTDLPDRKKKPPKGLRPDQWQILHAAAQEVDPDAADLLLFMVSSAWRWSECAPLSVAAVDHWVEDIEDENGELVVESFTFVTMGRVLRRVGSTFEIVDDAKSEAGNRRIRIVGPGEDMLLRRIEGKPLDALVFTTKRGGRWIYSAFHQRVWARPPNAKNDVAPRKPRILEVAVANGFTQTDVTPHWLRHTHVAFLILAGESLTAISRRVGHASTNTTSGVYGRMIEDASPVGLGKAAALIGGTTPKRIASKN